MYQLFEVPILVTTPPVPDAVNAPNTGTTSSSKLRTKISLFMPASYNSAYVPVILQRIFKSNNPMPIFSRQALSISGGSSMRHSTHMYPSEPDVALAMLSASIAVRTSWMAFSTIVVVSVELLTQPWTVIKKSSSYVVLAPQAPSYLVSPP